MGCGHISHEIVVSFNLGLLKNPEPVTKERSTVIMAPCSILVYFLLLLDQTRHAMFWISSMCESDHDVL